MDPQHQNPPDGNPQDRGIRKAAILVAGLDQASADAILEQLSPEQARRVRQVMVDLDEIDPKEQRRVMDEFFRVGHMVPAQQPAGIELDGRLAGKLPMSQSDSRACRSLHEAEADKLAGVLEKERPQTIALVLSHLLPGQAGSVLARLPGGLQADVVHRLVDLEETDPEIFREVERALQSRLSQQVQMQRRRVAGVKAIAGILEASDRRVGMQILDNLAVHDRPLAERLSPQPIEFDDLAQLDDDALSAVFRASTPELAMTALVGAPPQLIDRILRRLPAAAAKNVRHHLDHPGPIRLSDVEDARKEVCDLARRLSMEGRMQLPRNRLNPVW